MESVKRFLNALLTGKKNALPLIVCAFLLLCAGMSLQALHEAKKEAGLI